MRNLSLITILALLATAGCGTEEKSESMPVKDDGTCSAGFAHAYMSVDQKIKATYQSQANESQEQAKIKGAEATEACTSFKTSYADMTCNAIDNNGELVEFLASDINQDCADLAQSLGIAPAPESEATEEKTATAAATADLTVLQ